MTSTDSTIEHSMSENSLSPIVHLDGFEKRYGAIEAVRGVELEVARGETLAFLGPNGSGKTTILRALAGLHSPSAGRILIDGRDTALDPEKARSLLSYLPQKATMPGLLTGREVLEFFARLRKVHPSRIDEMLEMFALQDDAHRYTREYSGGMLQRVGLAVAFLDEVPLYVLDEPTLNLDSLGIRRLREHLEKMKGNGATVIFSSHSLSSAMQTADRVAVLVEGRMVMLQDVSVFRETVTRETKVRVVLRSTTEAILDAVRETGAELIDRNGRYINFLAMPNNRLDVVRAIEHAGGTIEEFHTEAPDWESLIRPHFLPKDEENQ